MLYYKNNYANILYVYYSKIYIKIMVLKTGFQLQISSCELLVKIV